MTVNTALFKTTDVLQNYIVDKDTGTPLAAGIVTLYEDQSRQILKNWYYQSGSSPDYTYIALQNPMTLSSVGTMQDFQGNDIEPFYYPYDEDDETDVQPYYITVYSSGGILQFTRENFPFQPKSSVTPITGFESLRNYITNGEYWNNLGSLAATNVLNQIICPSQHDNYNNRNRTGAITLTQVDTAGTAIKNMSLGNSDIRFMKDVVADSDTVTFTKMGTNTLTGASINQIAPEYYLTTTCTDAVSVAGEKFIQYPITMHLDTLKNTAFRVSLWARNESGGANNEITLAIYMYTGSGDGVSGVSSSVVYPIGENSGVVSLGTGDFTYISRTDRFPETSTFVLSSSGDDAFFLRIYFPIGATGEFSLSHTKPQLYLGEEVPSNEFSTYDMISSITNSSRTGDIRLTSNDYYPFGWVPMNNGTVGNSSSNATTLASVNAYQIFQWLWYSMQFKQGYAPMFSSAGVPSAYGATPYADWIANKSISLLRMLGNVLAGTVKSFADPETFTAAVATDIITVTDSRIYGDYTPVVVYAPTGSTLPAGLVSTLTYWTYIPAGTADTTSIQLFSDNTAAASSPLSYERLPDVGTASTADVAGTYANGTAGVGATLTETAGPSSVTIDGITPAAGTYVLLKNQTTTTQNGIYQVINNDGATSWQLKRPTFYDNAKNILINTWVYVTAGTTNSATQWYQTADGVLVGTTVIAYSALTFVPVDITDVGTGTFYIQLDVKSLGDFDGARELVIEEANLPSAITLAISASSVTNPGGVTKYGPGGTTSIGLTNGISTPMEGLQPTTFMNVFMKL